MTTQLELEMIIGFGVGYCIGALVLILLMELNIL